MIMNQHKSVANRLGALIVGFLLLTSLAKNGYCYDIVQDPWVDADIVAQTNDIVNMLKVTRDQLDTAKQQYAAIIGNYGWGSWQTQGQEFVDKWQWAANNWQDQLKGLSGGNSARYQELLAQYKAANDSMTEDEFHKTYSGSLSKALANEVSTNQAAGTSSQMTFEQVNSHVTELQNLAQQIESTDKNANTKSAVDINTRAQIQNGLMMAEMIRAQALNNNIAASQQATKIASAVQAAKFNVDPQH